MLDIMLLRFRDTHRKNKLELHDIARELTIVQESQTHLLIEK